MKKILFLLTTLTALVWGGNIPTIGTGSTTGNYYGMVNDVMSNDYCGKTMPEGVTIESTGGSVDNLLGLTNKKYSMGVVQSDVLMNMAKTSPRSVNMNFIKIIAGLHNETVHLLIPNGYQPTGGKKDIWSVFKSSDKKVQVVSLESLKNQEIASWGGSMVSAKALSFFFNLNWKISATTEDSVINSRVPVVLVGGQPYAPVEKLLASGKWSLVSIDHAEVSIKAPAVYTKMEASYKVNGNPMIVPTIGVQALFVGKSFRKEDRNADTIALASCIEDSLADLADDPNTNPNWASVYENRQRGEIPNWASFSIK